MDKLQELCEKHVFGLVNYYTFDDTDNEIMTCGTDYHTDDSRYETFVMESSKYYFKKGASLGGRVW